MTYLAQPYQNGPAVNGSLTAKRRWRVVENDEYAAFARRVLRAYSRRVASGDIEAITEMAALAAEMDTAIRDAITGCAPAATAGPTSQHGSALPGREPSSAGADARHSTVTIGDRPSVRSP